MGIEKYTWLERAKETHNFHVRKIRGSPNWSIRKTASLLRRSLGSISEDLLIASWYKSHRTIIEKFEFAYQALEYIREKEKERLEEIE